MLLNAFREVVVADFEFAIPPGERPDPTCLVAHELRSGRRFRLMRDQMGPAPPYATGPDVLFVAYYASAELGCYRVLGWPMPERILDLFTEFRDRTNGLPTPAGAGLLGALTYFGLDGMGATEKKELQEAIGNDTWEGRFTPEKFSTIARATFWLSNDCCRPCCRASICRVPCCAGATWPPPAPWSTTARRSTLRRCALLRTALGGYPGRPNPLRSIVHGVYDGPHLQVRSLGRPSRSPRHPWPLLESGRLDLSDDTFRQMAKSYPLVSPYRELRSCAFRYALNDLAVGQDGRNRTILSAFRARTSRNQPSNTKSIFGPSVWLRGLIKPPPGYGVAYIDWSQQEFGMRPLHCRAIWQCRRPISPAIAI